MIFIQVELGSPRSERDPDDIDLDDLDISALDSPTSQRDSKREWTPVLEPTEAPAAPPGVGVEMQDIGGAGDSEAV